MPAPNPGLFSSSSSSLLPKRASRSLTSTPVPAMMRRTGSWSTFNTLDSPYAQSRLLSISDKFSLSPDPRSWGSDLSPDLVEADDHIHNPVDLKEKDGRLRMERDGNPLSSRGFANLGCLICLVAGLVTLFAGYPIIVAVTRHKMSNLGAFNVGGINASGQIPLMSGNFGLIDQSTPKEAFTKPSWRDGSEMTLVFSDEFNTDGRSFYPGDDPYWEAGDLHYWATNNLEWYDPAAVTTRGGSLVITLSQRDTHDLNFQGGMISTWNKFCFTGGYIETSVVLPGLNNIAGLWPAVWTMGNLGRAGYGATLEGMWPYSYDSCDVGTAPNQTHNGLPKAATVNGDQSANGALSYLPGQKLSRCTCPGESHPGPKHPDGTFVGRSAPEIDVIEAQVATEAPSGEVSQSAQWAPFNEGYVWFNTSNNEVIVNPSISRQNSYTGGSQQQATSVVTKTNQNCYEGRTGCFSVYGFEYRPGFDNAYITWISDNKISWTLNVAGMAADPKVQIAARPVSQEPMYVIVNLGMSNNFGNVDLGHIPFPVHMYVDYIRVYQPKDLVNIGCDPKGFPTANYINQYIEAYTNPNLTTWVDDFHQPFPKSSFLGQC